MRERRDAPDSNHELVVLELERLEPRKARGRLERLARLVGRLGVELFAEGRARRGHGREPLVGKVDLVGPGLVVARVGIGANRLQRAVVVDGADGCAGEERREGEVRVGRDCTGGTAKEGGDEARESALKRVGPRSRGGGRGERAHRPSRRTAAGPPCARARTRPSPNRE